MTAEYIIIAILIIGSIAGMIWIAPDVREAFSEPFGDVPEIPREGRTSGKGLPSGGKAGEHSRPSDTHTQQHNKRGV